jgi:arylformamidase
MPRKLHDISPLISPALAVFPGDTSFSSKHLLHLDRGDAVTLSTITATAHLGAHVDGTNHYDAQGQGVEALPIELFLGPCQLITVKTSPSQYFGYDALQAEPATSRVLLRTNSFTDPNKWTNTFAAPDASCIDTLAQRGVQLLGVDTPSVDLATSKDLPTHNACRLRNIAILEGLVFNTIPDGQYELFAFPLKMQGLDASPVRAVLRELD